MEIEFEAVNPWGTVYIEELRRCLEICGYHCIDDPRQEGSDCWGLLISKEKIKLDAALQLVISFEENSDKYLDEYEDYTDAYWEDLDALDAQFIDVCRVLCDWKHLEIHGHDDELAKIGITLKRYSEEEPPYLFRFETEPLVPQPTGLDEVLQAISSSEEKQFNRGINALDESVAEHVLNGSRWNHLGKLVPGEFLSGLAKGKQLQVALHALAYTPSLAQEIEVIDLSDLHHKPKPIDDVITAPKSLKGLKNLRELRVFGFGKLRILDTFQGLPLQKVVVEDKEIRSLPNSIYAPTLKSLDTVDADMRFGPYEDFYQNNNIESLRYSPSWVPDEISGLQRLENLEIRLIRLRQLPKWLFELKLKRLCLRGIRLTDLPDLSQIESLEVLDVGGCQGLKTLPESLENCKKLKLLRLVPELNIVRGKWKAQGIKWETMPEVIHRLPVLEKIIIDRAIYNRMLDGDEMWLERLQENEITIIISKLMTPMRRKALKNCIDKYGPTYDVQNNIDYNWGQSPS
jgi:hypothetical protein